MLPKTLTLATLCLAGVLATGCAQLQENLDSASTSLRDSDRSSAVPQAPSVQRTAPAETAPASEEATPEPTSPVRIVLDNSRDKAADQFGIYWESERRVSTQPNFTLSMDSSMGDFQRLMINVYLADDEGRETGQPWAITDYGGDQILVPNRSINLSNPGAVTIISPTRENVSSIPFQSGKTYVALFVVSASESSHTHKVRFTVR